MRDGMSSKSSYENPSLYGRGAGGVDPDVVAITSKAPTWSFDALPQRAFDICREKYPQHRSAIDAAKSVASLGGDGGVFGRKNGAAVTATLRSKNLAGGKRTNWLRATAMRGSPKNPGEALRAVWTVSSIEDEEANDGRASAASQRTFLLNDSYEDCIKRTLGKFVEVEVLLPRAGGGGAPPSVVYRVPIKPGTVNPMGLVSKSRATTTLYPNGRKMAAAGSASEGGARGQPVARSSMEKDEAIPLGLTNVHLPLGPGLVDPGWVKGKKVFWSGRPVGLL